MERVVALVMLRLAHEAEDSRDWDECYYGMENMPSLSSYKSRRTRQMWRDSWAGDRENSQVE
ncbi:hypothetical protein BDZ89DRAFT_1077787, partial [Hymenopellis radicata]